MVKLYKDSDLWDAIMQRRRILAGFYAVTAAFIAGLLTLVILYSQLPYKDPNATWMIVVSCVITALYIVFVFPYMGICFKRSNAYCRMLKFISVGLKESMKAPFAGIENWMTRDGVDVNVATFSINNIKREETMIRQIYVDGEKDFPAFQEGFYARVVSQGNLLIEYELTEERENLTAPDKE